MLLLAFKTIVCECILPGMVGSRDAAPAILLLLAVVPAGSQPT